jgi:putative protease
MILQKKPKILAPVGSYTCLEAAIQAKADMVYFGLDHYHMRSNATTSFTIKDLKKIGKLCKQAHIEPCVALNILLFDEELSKVQKILQKIKEAEIHSVICCDIASILESRKLGLSVTASTQLNICNMEAVKFYSQYCDTIVLARELDYEHIQSIIKKIKKENICGPSGKLLQIEIFAHGALCMSISGQCALSQTLYNKSANRGICLHPCRRKWDVIDQETKQEIQVNDSYVFSMKDLCILPFLKEMLSLGVDIFKIEGRARTADYVYKVIKTYKNAIEDVLSGSYTQEKIDQYMQDVKEVYNRSFWNGGYYLGKHLDEWSRSAGTNATKQKVYMGKVVNYFPKIGVVEIKVEAKKLPIKSPFIIMGPKTGIVEGKIDEIRHSQNPLEAVLGEVVSFKIENKVKKNDSLYLIRDRET